VEGTPQRLVHIREQIDRGGEMSNRTSDNTHYVNLSSKYANESHLFNKYCSLIF